ncbi:MAG: hypothetical protein GY757_26805 [bacterium]|nr:hypothetical protein [bacterium]
MNFNLESYLRHTAFFLRGKITKAQPTHLLQRGMEKMRRTIKNLDKTKKLMHINNMEEKCR